MSSAARQHAAHELADKVTRDLLLVLVERMQHHVHQYHYPL